MRILKFGGKSLSSVEKSQKICKYIKKIYKNEKKLIIVVSAMGNKTNNLLTLANKFGESDFAKSDLAKLLATGELESSALISIMLNTIGVPAKSFSAHELQIKTFGDPLCSRISYINKTPLIESLKNNIVSVVAGFQGINSNNEITTLGRGGSDTTAAALAAIFGINAEIYSDFNGIYAGDPRLLNFKKLKSVNYDIISNMAKAGAKVLESRATKIAKNNNIKILCKSSATPENSGSIVSDIESNIIAISSIDNLCQITIIFSDYQKLNLLTKNVLNEINNYKFYNFNIENDKISFYVESENKLKIISKLSSKLNLIKK